MKFFAPFCVVLLLVLSGLMEGERAAQALGAQPTEDEAEDRAEEEAEESAEEEAEDRAEEEAEERAEEEAEDRAEEEAEERAEEEAEERAEEEAEERAEEEAEERAEEEAEERAEEEAEERAEEEAEERAEEEAEDRAEEEAEDRAEEEAEDRAEEEAEDRAEEEAEDRAEDEAEAAEDRLDRLEEAAEDDAEAAEDLAEAVEDSRDDAADDAEDVREDTAKRLQDRRDDDDEDDDNDNGGDDAARRAGLERAEAAFETFFDPSGEPAIAGEIVALIGRDRLADIRDSGYALAEERVLEAVDLVAVRIGLPENADPVTELRSFTEAFDPDTVDYNHVYDLNADQSEGTGVSLTSGRSAALPAGARIGVMEARVDRAHPCLQNLPLDQRTFHDGAAPGDAAHALAVISLLAGCRDGQATDRPSILNADVFFRPDAMQSTATAIGLVRGLDWLVSRRVDAINMSLSGPPNRLLHRAVQIAHRANIPVIAAVGNAGPAAPPRYPAAYDEAIGITAVDSAARIYLRAGRGPHVAFAAPGVDVAAAATDGTMASVSGTSMAAPRATRVVVAARAAMPGLTVTELVKRLGMHAVDLGPRGRDPIYGYGYLERWVR